MDFAWRRCVIGFPVLAPARPQARRRLCNTPGAPDRPTAVRSSPSPTCWRRFACPMGTVSQAAVPLWRSSAGGLSFRPHVECDLAALAFFSPRVQWGCNAANESGFPRRGLFIENPGEVDRLRPKCRQKSGAPGVEQSKLGCKKLRRRARNIVSRRRLLLGPSNPQRQEHSAGDNEKGRDSFRGKSTARRRNAGVGAVGNCRRRSRQRG
jgi:hypothetical protein